MPLFKKSVKEAWADAERDRDAEFERIMGATSAADLAIDLLRAFGPDGARPSKPKTHIELVEWQLNSLALESRRQRALVYKKLNGPVREALQILEHAELVHRVSRTDSADTWRVTSAGSDALTAGETEIRRLVGQRNGAAQAASAQRSVAERLHGLDALRESGDISEDEYVAQRQNIIGSI
jgi:hypothetical protein